MASNTNRKRTKEHESVLDRTMKRVTESHDYQKDNWHKNWERDNKLYNSERWNAQYHGVTDTFVPLPFSTVETMVAAMNNANLRFDYESNDPLRQTSTAPLNALIDEWWEQDQWDLLFEEGEREMFITGMAGNMVSWELDHPHIEHYAMLDMIVDPTIKNPYQLQQPGAYAGRHFYIRKGSLDDFEVVDTDEDSPTYGQMKKRFKMPRNSGTPSAGGDHEDDKSLKERFASSTLSRASDDQDEVHEVWDVDRVVTVLNRKDVIEDVENPYKARHRVILRRQYIEAGLAEEAASQRAEDEATGLVPFFFFRNYRRSSLFYARSEIDAIAKPTEYLNDMRNMSSDAVIKTLARQRWLDPSRQDWIDLIDDNDLEAVFPFKEGEMGFYDPPRVDSAAFNVEAVTKQEIREATALDQIMKGQGPTGDPTATQINAQVSQSSERIESKARILEKDGLYWMAHILFRMFQLYVDQPLVVKVKGADMEGLKTSVTMPDGTERPLPEGSALLDPADYQGDWRPKVTLEVDAQSKQLDEQRGARETFLLLANNPNINLAELNKAIIPKVSDFSKDEVDKITTMDPAAAMPGMDPSMMGGLPPEAALMDAPVPLDAAAPTGPVPPTPDAGGDVDEAALQQFLTPEEWAQLQAALSQQGAPA